MSANTPQSPRFTTTYWVCVWYVSVFCICFALLVALFLSANFIFLSFIFYCFRLLLLMLIFQQSMVGLWCLRRPLFFSLLHLSKHVLHICRLICKEPAIDRDGKNNRFLSMVPIKMWRRLQAISFLVLSFFFRRLFLTILLLNLAANQRWLYTHFRQFQNPNQQILVLYVYEIGFHFKWSKMWALPLLCCYASIAQFSKQWNISIHSH